MSRLGATKMGPRFGQYVWGRSAARNFALSLIHRCRETSATRSTLSFLLFNSSFLRHYRCTGRRILVRLRSFIVLFFFSALDLAGLLILTVGVSPTRWLVSWCDVCSESALLGQGLTGNKAQSGLEECCS